MRTRKKMMLMKKKPLWMLAAMKAACASGLSGLAVPLAAAGWREKRVLAGERWVPILRLPVR